MASILRTLIEQHDLSLPEAVSKIRTILEAEESEAGKTKTLNILAILASGIGALASMTNPIGLALCAVSIGVNWSCQHAHRKDYGKIRDEQDLIHHAPLILDSMVQYYAANIATESTLLAAYEHCLNVFDEDTGVCISTAQIQGSNQFQTVEYLPVDYFRSSVQLALQQEDPVLRIAGKATGLDRMYQRMGIEAPVQEQVRSLPSPTPIQEAATLPTQAVGQNTRLNAIPVEVQRSRQWDDDEQLSKSSDRHEWMQDLLSYPSVLIWGAPGAGKSTFAEWLVKERVKLDHKLEILDPHRQYGQWDGLDVFGDGMDYAGIDDRLKEFADLVESRYLARSKRPDFNPRPLTVLAEEFTQWSKKCPHAPAFFEMSVSDIRKINCHVVYVSHNRTLSALGGAKGLAATRDSALLELELLAKVDDATGKAVPAMRGMLKYPGRAPIEVAIPDFSNPAPPQNQGTPLSSVLLNTIRGDGSGKK